MLRPGVTQEWRLVFVCALELALDESLSHQHMGAVYHRGRSPSASTSESHGGGRDHVNDQELLGAPLRRTMQRQEGLWIQGVNAMVPQRRVFHVCATKVTSDESPGHQHMGAVYHQGRSQIASTSESYGGDLIIQRWDFHVVIDPVLSWRESISRKRGIGGGECKGKLQVPRQDGRAEAKELHKTGVDGHLIKRDKSEGLHVDARVLDQGTK
ncbi:hypothetical protein GW17_00040392 [Ensete ventricosum]|nr:hypothetical protein GW17_00040392 [Ensete ventricosum]RZS09707.1 hypothetical protein BHM03_00040813 [Ensete ventricosum]